MNEEFISEVFNSEDNGIIDVILRSIDRVFYTTLVKVIVNYIVECFLKFENVSMSHIFRFILTHTNFIHWEIPKIIMDNCSIINQGYYP